jgi:hypothetical protein
MKSSIMNVTRSVAQSDRRVTDLGEVLDGRVEALLRGGYGIGYRGGGG